MMEKLVASMLVFTMCRPVPLLDNCYISTGQKPKAAYRWFSDFLYFYLSLVIYRALAHKTNFCMAF